MTVHLDQQPGVQELDVDLAQIYLVRDFLNREECEEVIAAINKSMRPSTVTRGRGDYRTSQTCNFREDSSELAWRLDQRISALLGIDPELSEPIQGQRYNVGEYFKEHCDWFAPGTPEYVKHTSHGGQRTWTVMVYLNDVEKGGKTRFKHLDLDFTPELGLALIWNNLFVTGEGNPHTLHEAMPVEKGNKWVITKWFREQLGRNHWTEEQKVAEKVKDRV